jgi:predicted Rdx family selenoprotein
LLLAKAPDADIALTKGRNGIFDIIVEGTLRYSKQRTGRFPTDPEVEAVLT